MVGLANENNSEKMEVESYGISAESSKDIEIQNLKRENNALKLENENLKSEIEDLNRQIMELKNIILSLEKEISSLKNNNNTNTNYPQLIGQNSVGQFQQNINNTIISNNNTSNNNNSQCDADDSQNNNTTNNKPNHAIQNIVHYEENSEKDLDNESNDIVEPECDPNDL